MRQDHVFSVTLTELIVILLFLFLLVTAWKMRKLETAIASAHAENQSLAESLAGRKKLPPDFWKLVKAAAARGQKIEQVLAGREELKEEILACQQEQKRLSEENGELSALVSSADQNGLAEENIILEGQLRDLQGRCAHLERQIGRGGIDFPPCWADSDGKIQFLYSVVIHEDGLGVQPAWPAERDRDAASLPNVDDALSDRSSTENFLAHTREIFDLSVDSKCRHYVHIYDEAVSKEAYKDQRLAVESHFYKLEHR